MADERGVKEGGKRMLGKVAKVVLLLGIGVLFFANLALAKSKTINLGKDVVLPDGQTLKAGQYAVVVDEKLDQVQFIQHGTVVVKHACKCVKQEKPNDSDGILSEESQNKMVLHEIRFRGETRIITLPS
jgi:hypothetical protein